MEETPCKIMGRAAFGETVKIRIGLSIQDLQEEVHRSDCYRR